MGVYSLPTREPQKKRLKNFKLATLGAFKGI